MKKIILGYLKEEALKLELDLKDLQILRYIYHFINLGYKLMDKHFNVLNEKFYLTEKWKNWYSRT